MILNCSYVAICVLMIINLGIAILWVCSDYISNVNDSYIGVYDSMVHSTGMPELINVVDFIH